MKKKTKTPVKKKTAAKTKKTAKKTIQKKVVTVSQPELYVHSTHTGPQLCIKTSAKKADGVILPEDIQAELEALYNEWTEQGTPADFMEFPKAKKWLKALVKACTFSEIAKSPAKKKKK